MGTKYTLKVKEIPDPDYTAANENCWETGEYDDFCVCALCAHQSECSGYEEQS